MLKTGYHFFVALQNQIENKLNTKNSKVLFSISYPRKWNENTNCSAFCPVMTRPPTRYLFGNGSLDDALAVFDGYDAAMDEPVMLMYEEIMAAFPEAKFLLTISDAESWFTNYVEMAHLVDASGNSSELKFWYSLPANCIAMQSWGCNFLHTPSAEDKDTCLKNYDRHIKRVQDVIPPERLLVYNWSDGWSPLSHFLGSRIPEEQFPHEDIAKFYSEKRVAAKLGMSLGS